MKAAWLLVVLVLAWVALAVGARAISKVPKHQQPIFNVKTYGATGNGKTIDTKAIQLAIAAAAQAGGGEVYFPAGTYLTGAFNLTSNMTLYIDKGATVQAIKDTNYFPLIAPMPSYPIQSNVNSDPRHQSFLFAYGVSNLRITGQGTVDGAGNYWWDLHSQNKLNHSRPHLVEIMNSDSIEISHLTFQYSPMYNLHPYNSRQVTVENVYIYNPLDGKNTDGIDPDSCSDVSIINNTIYTMDDNISLKAGHFIQGTQFNVSTQNVVIAGNTFGYGGGIAIGSETAGGIRNVSIHDNTLYATANIVRIKSCPRWGGIIEDVTYQRNSLEAGGIAIFVDMSYECGPMPPGGNYTIIRDVYLDGITCDACGQAGTFECIPQQPCQVNMDNIDIWSVRGFACQNVKGTIGRHVFPSPCYG